MADRPIIFSAPMVRALLDGLKTQTRRILKPQPPKPEDFFGSDFGMSPAVADGVKLYSVNDYRRLPKHPTKWELLGSVGVARDAGFPKVYDARYAAGDRLWVREAARVGYQGWSHDRGDSHQVSYRADENEHGQWLDLPTCGTGIRHGKAPSVFPSKSFKHDGSLRWSPAIHMPRWASRLTLIVEGVKVERLQDITNEDCIAEGIPVHPNKHAPRVGPTVDDFARRHNLISHYGGEFLRLWDSGHKPSHRWDANPWVVAISFRVIRANIDAPPDRGGLEGDHAA